MNTSMFIADTISEYNDINYSLDDIFMESVLEADTESVDDDTNKENFARKLVATVEKLCQEIFSIIDRFVTTVSNIFSRIAQTDTGFKEHCRVAMVKNKPLEAVKLIAFEYNNEYLEDQMTKISNECMRILTSLKTDYQRDESESDALNMKKKDIVIYILNKIGQSREVTDINLYFEVLKKNYRVAKKELLFKASLGHQYYNIAVTDLEKANNLATAKQKIMKNQAKTIKSELMLITKNKTTQNSIKRKAVHFYKHAGKVYNFFTAFVKIYVQFKIERALTYRAVLKKLWHFQ